MKTKKIIEKYFEYVNAGKWDDYLGLFADDIVMDEQLMGHIEGKEQLAKGLEQLKNAKQFRNEPVQIVAERNRAMAVWHITAMPVEGVNIDAKGANYYELENGRIKYFSNYHDTAPFAAIMGG